MLERILKVINEENLSHSSYADEIGIQRSSLSHILNGRNNPSLDFVIKTLERFPKLNPEWLILGKGEMYREFEEKQNKIDEIDEIPISQDLFSTISQDSVIERNEESPVSPLEIPENEEVVIAKVEKHVSQVLLFYSDSTYHVYKPEKPV
jgi:transcriptional regulator with XRE-family HTH domain